MDETASIGGKSSKIQQSVDFYTKGTSHFPLLIALSSHMRRQVRFRWLLPFCRLGNKGQFGPILINLASTGNTVERLGKANRIQIRPAELYIR